MGDYGKLYDLEQHKPPQRPSPTPQPESPTPETPSHGDVMTSRRHDVAVPSPAPSAGFDITRETASRDSLRLSVDETRALDAMRDSLKWDHELTVSKNDICRVALHALIEDFRAKGDRSQAVSRLKKKSTR